MFLLKTQFYRRMLTFVFVLVFLAYIVFEIKLHIKILYPKAYQSFVEKYAKEYQLDSDLVYAVIRVESHFNPDAVSHKNAFGLMQITEQTGRWGAQKIGIEDFKKEMLKDPEINIRIGCWYLHVLHKEFDGNRKLALAAYNGGSGNVNKWLKDRRLSKSGNQLDIIPFPETNKYVARVIKDYRRYKELYK